MLIATVKGADMYAERHSKWRAVELALLGVVLLSGVGGPEQGIPASRTADAPALIQPSNDDIARLYDGPRELWRFRPVPLIAWR